MSKDCEVVLVIHKLSRSPYEWKYLREEKVKAQVTPKRVFARLMTFDRETGKRVDAHKDYSSWYRYSIKPETVTT